MTKRLCILLPMHWSDRMGGSQYQAKLLIEYLVDHYDVEITYLTTRMDDAFVPRGYDLVRFSTPAGVRRYALFFDLWRLYRALSNVRPDIIFQQVGCAHTGIAAFYARRSRCHLFFRVSSDTNVERSNEPWWRVHKIIDRKFLDYGKRHAEGIFAQTSYQQLQLRAIGGRDSILIRNFHPKPTDTIDKSGTPTVVWVANLKPLKNPLAFVRLAKRFTERSDFRFLMVGAPMGTQEWNTLVANEIRSTENLEHLGAKPQEEVNRLFAQSHILVNTSDYEGFSNTFVQAWLREVPVVSLTVNPDGLLDGDHLGFCSKEDEQELFHNVKYLLDDPGLRTRMGQECRRYAERHHSESNADKMAQYMGLRRLGHKE